MKSYDYITSDLHFFHKNIIVYCGRPYDREDTARMNEDLLAEFDKLPNGSSILYLGDFVLSSGRTFEEVASIVERIKRGNKRISIVLGNHDRDLGRYLKGNYKKMPAKELFHKLGFDEVFDTPIELNGTLFSHEPCYVSGMINVHGHTHDKDVDETYFNRACDNWAMMEVVKAHPELTKQEIDIDTSITDDKYSVDPMRYINVCWDRQHRLVRMSEVFV